MEEWWTSVPEGTPLGKFLCYKPDVFSGMIPALLYLDLLEVTYIFGPISEQQPDSILLVLEQ